MSTIKKKLHINTASFDIGCSSCMKPKLSDIFNPKPKPTNTTKYHKRMTTNNLYYYSSSSSSKTNISPPYNDYDTTTTRTTNTFSPIMETPSKFYNYELDDDNADTKEKKKKNSSKTVRGFGRLGGESVAVEKDSDDPYLDFRHSMLQMILEKEIYSKDDLKELLNCFLQINSPYHHGIIVRAFTEIWNGVFSVRASGGSESDNNNDYYNNTHYNPNYFGCSSRDYYYY